MHYRVKLIGENQLLLDEIKTYFQQYQLYEISDNHHFSVTKFDDYHLWIIDASNHQKQVLEIVNKIKVNSHDSIIFVISDSYQINIKLDFLRNGCDDYLIIPFEYEELFIKANRSLERAYKFTLDNQITIDIYDIDLSKRRVYAQGNQIHLSEKEYEILIYFIKNRGVAISRNQILEKIWSSNYYGSDRVIDDTIRRLRMKLPEINLKTIYGFGYRLD